MGMLKDGKWIVEGIAKHDDKGQFQRPDSTFRDYISDQHVTYKPEANRYHLYVSYACPWAHRTLIFRKLKKLENIITLSVVHPDMMDYGWSFSTDFPGATGDSVNQANYLYEVYQKSEPDCTCKVTVPVLWDKETSKIVNNESADIIRIFNNAFNELTGNKEDYYPEHLRAEIDNINERVYRNINNGVYKAGFATEQEAYEEAVSNLFSELNHIEAILSKQPYLVGDKVTEADWRLLTTLLRFESVYYFHFKCNLKPLSTFKNIVNYANQLLSIDGLAETLRLDHIKRHYYYSQRNVNPHGIVAKGPVDEVLTIKK